MIVEPSSVEIAVRVLVGGLLGAVVGLERESAGQDAGFRTHLLLALGSALFGAASVGAFDDFITDDPTNVRVDVTRVASYVAAGVGFIGGGAILKHAGTVRGITTASSLWAAAAIGLCAGLGFWVGAITATVVALVALAGLKPVSNWIDRRANRPRTLVVTVDRLAVGAEVVGLVQRHVTQPIKSIQIGQSDSADDGEVREVAVEFWSEPGSEIVEALTNELEDALGDAIRSVWIRR